MHERPPGSCVLHRPPDPDRDPVWVMATPGYVTCEGCLEKLRSDLRELVKRYLRLNPAPGGSASDGTPRPPGFHSTPVGSLHIMAMRDRRSSQLARAWIAVDGKVHLESEHPPRSVPGDLDRITQAVARLREVKPPHRSASVPQLAEFIDRHLNWATTRDPLTVAVAGTIRALLTQLRNVTDRRAVVGVCPGRPEDPNGQCGRKLRAPVHGDTIRCACGRTWSGREEWRRLGHVVGGAA